MRGGYGNNASNVPAGSQFDSRAPWNASGVEQEEESGSTFQERFNDGLDRLLKLLDDDDGEGCCTACGEPLDENGKCPFDEVYESEPEPAGSRDRDEWRHEAAAQQRLK